MESANWYETVAKSWSIKIGLTKELLSFAQSRGIKPQYVVFDSWYAAAVVLNLLRDLQWSYVAQIKSNRKLGGVQVRHLWPHRFGQAIGKLSRE